MFFVDKIFFTMEGASDVRLRAKGIELVNLNSPAEELKGLQEICRRKI
jgi:hypothetical protein